MTNKFRRIAGTFGIGMMLTGAAFAQTGSDQELAKKGATLFSKGEYELAFDFYYKLKDKQPDNLQYSYRAGICSIYHGDPETALSLLKAAYDKDPNLTDINFYLGRAYLLNNQFDDALTQFNLQIAKEPDEALKRRLQQYITNCQTGKELVAKPVNVEITNLGRPLNSPGSEFVTLMPGDESVAYYSYKGTGSFGGKHYSFGKTDSTGTYFEDVFFTKRNRDTWLDPVGLSDKINTGAHEAAICFSADGSKFYFYRSSQNDGGDIYVSTRVNGEWGAPERVKGINSPYWEGSIAFYPDEKTAIFASDRPGGYGRKDLYRATLQADGSWGAIENMGPSINTALDDDAPYIQADGKAFFFSSRGHESIGGYDVFRADAGSDAKSWKDPVNLGYPLNTTADEIFYTQASDGLRAYYSSNRPGGYGGMDMYIIEPGVPTDKQLLVKGIVTLDDRPTNANVAVTYVNKTEIQGDYTANAVNGHYQIGLPVGENYKLIFIVSGCDDSVKTFDASELKGFTAKEFNVSFYTDWFKHVHYERFGIHDTSSFTRRLLQLGNDSVTIGMANWPSSGNLKEMKVPMRVDSSSNYKDEQGYAVEKGLFIIIGSFRNKEYATRLQNKIRDDGKYPAHDLVFNWKNQFLYVVVGRPKTKEEAVSLVREARKEYPDAWIQELK